MVVSRDVLFDESAGYFKPNNEHNPWTDFDALSGDASNSPSENDAEDGNSTINVPNMSEWSIVLTIQDVENKNSSFHKILNRRKRCEDPLELVKCQSTGGKAHRFCGRSTGWEAVFFTHLQGGEKRWVARSSKHSSALSWKKDLGFGFKRKCNKYTYN